MRSAICRAAPESRAARTQRPAGRLPGRANLPGRAARPCSDGRKRPVNMIFCGKPNRDRRTRAS